MTRRWPMLCSPEPTLRAALVAALATLVVPAALAACGSNGTSGSKPSPPPASTSQRGAGGAGGAGAPIVSITPPSGVLAGGSSTSSAGGGGAGGAGSTSAATTTGSGGAGSTSAATTTGSGGAGSTSAATTTGSGGAGSSSAATTVGSGGDGSGSSVSSGGGDGGACGTEIDYVNPMPTQHVPTCSPVTYDSNPPTSGNHYPDWAAYKTYQKPVPRGFYVHDLEHGAIVITYNCPDGCDADLAALAAFVASLPQDPICVPPLKNRIVVTPDPKLDVKFAASAWEWMLRSSCFDLEALAGFIQKHYGHGGEDWCANGYDVTADSGIPADCGDAP